MPSKHTKNLTVRFPDAILEAIGEAAEAENTTSADIVRRAVAGRFEAKAEADRLAAMEARLQASIQGVGQQVGRLIMTVQEVAQ